MTPIATRLKLRLDERLSWFHNWLFKWHAIGGQKPVKIDLFNSRHGEWAGIGYSGSVEDIFWEAATRGARLEVVGQLSWVDNEVRRYDPSSIPLSIDECAGLLISFAARWRRATVEKDRILRGDGTRFPSLSDRGDWTGVTPDDIWTQAEALKLAIPRGDSDQMPTIRESDMPTRKPLSKEAIERCLARLDERISELKSFDISHIPKGSSPELAAMSAAVRDTLDRCFGEGTPTFGRFEIAAELQAHFMMSTSSYPDQSNYQQGAAKNIARSVALLQEAKRTLQEDLVDAEHALKAPQPRQHLSRRVFVVHGHDEGPREAVARFLERLGFEAVILHERANKGRTIIEKIEAHGDVDFAVVLLTPDDVGSVRGGEATSRARQNVLMELGYFIGRLGRANVCALKKGELDIPTDFAGVVWEQMDAGSGWKQALGRELEAAGHQIDWNAVMRTFG